MSPVARHFALYLAAASAVGAQEVTGRVEGRVLSPDNVGIEGVQLVVTSPNLLGNRGTATDRNGRFVIPALPVGTYRVAARRLGFRPLAVEDVPVRLGITASLPRVILEPAPVQLSEVVISAAAAGLDRASTATSMTLEAAKLATLPLGRNFREIALLAPMATPSFLGDGVNLGGATGYENNFYVDGINVTSPINGSTSLDLPYNFIQDIQVRIGGSTAEDAQALGGVINVVTPSGSNRFGGKLFAFFSNDALQSQPRLAAGDYQTGFTFYDVGVSYGGPIARDRLWFFAAYNPKYERRLKTYSFGTLPELRHQQQFAGKLSARVGANTSLFLTVLGDPTRLEPLNLPPLVFGVPGNPEVIRTRARENDLATSLRFQHLLFSRVLIDGGVSLMSRLETSDPASESGFDPAFIDLATGTVSGGHGGRSRYEGSRRTAAVNLSWEAASHSFRTGAQYESLVSDLWLGSRGPWQGGEVYRSSDTLYTWHWFTYTASGRVDVRNPAFFVQDAWRVTRWLSVNGGLRYSRQDVVNLRWHVLGLRVDDGLQPRIGVVLEPGEPGAQRVFASYSRVADQVAGWLGSSYGSVAEAVGIFRQDPRVDTTGGTVPPATTEGLTGADDNVRAQTTDDWAVGYERRVARATTVSGRAVRRVLHDGVQIALDPSGQLIWGNPGRGRLSNFPRPRRTYDALEVAVEREANAWTWYRLSYVFSKTYGNYPGIYVSDWRIPSAHYDPQYILPTQHVNAAGLLPNDRTHLVKAVGARRFGFGGALGASLVVASGTPLSEYGAIELPFPYRGFAAPRGSSGRTPAIWDLSLRASSDLRALSRRGEHWRVLLDLEHVGSPRKAVDFDQIHYTCLENGRQSCVNGGYRRVTQYQPPMVVRLGTEVSF